MGDGHRVACLDESLYKSIDPACQKSVAQADGGAVTVLDVFCWRVQGLPEKMEFVFADPQT